MTEYVHGYVTITNVETSADGNRVTLHCTVVSEHGVSLTREHMSATTTEGSNDGYLS